TMFGDKIAPVWAGEFFLYEGWWPGCRFKELLLKHRDLGQIGFSCGPNTHVDTRFGAPGACTSGARRYCAVGGPSGSCSFSARLARVMRLVASICVVTRSPGC